MLHLKTVAESLNGMLFASVTRAYFKTATGAGSHGAVIFVERFVK